LQHVEHLLDAYHDGELSPGRRQQVEAHLDRCPICRTELSRLEWLSGLLRQDELPDTFTSAETFRSQVGLRLSRRRQSQAGYPSWVWYLVPVALICALVSLLGLLALTDVLREASAFLGWTGIDVSLVLGLPGIPDAGGVVALVTDAGRLTWQVCLYLATLVVFVSYVGWVGVLWRARTRPSLRKES
jgi:predicted anti-sigma-YlaC factor YlaD